MSDARWFGAHAVERFFRTTLPQAKQAIDIWHGSGLVEQNPDSPWEYRFITKIDEPIDDAIEKIRALSNSHGDDPLIKLVDIRSD